MKPAVVRSLITICFLVAGPSLCEATDDPAAQVRQAETAFAQTMADRDLDAFVGFIDDEAVFFGHGPVLRGVEAVKKAWSMFFMGPKAPFSWEPEKVQVLESGNLALSSGPVRDPQGRRVGTFNSVWRRNAEGRWKVVFDLGCPPCDCSAEIDKGSGSP